MMPDPNGWIKVEDGLPDCPPAVRGRKKYDNGEWETFYPIIWSGWNWYDLDGSVIEEIEEWKPEDR